MKKYLILAAAALVASAACTKVEVTESPDTPISFQVANYVPQTKANVAFEGTNFYTYAWFHPTSGVPQPFMTNETISFYEGTADGKGEWRPARMYFWPKSGYINFFSYAYSGTWATATDPKPAAVVDATGTTDLTAGTVRYGNPSSVASNHITVPVDGDILLANAAYRYSSSEASTNTYNINYSGPNYVTDVTGVPTLFHHLLSKVKFQARFDASEYSGSGYAWNLVINSITLNYADKGAITVPFTDPGTDHTQATWPYTSPSLVQWTPYVTATETGDQLGSIVANTGYPVNSATTILTSIPVTVGGSASHEAGSGVELIAESSVLPQNLTTTGATVTINYTLTSYYNDGESYVQHITETTTTPALALNTFKNGSDQPIGTWDMNYKYIYTITIKPNKTVTFDPAVVDWESTAIAGFYTYPNS